MNMAIILVAICSILLIVLVAVVISRKRKPRFRKSERKCEICNRELFLEENNEGITSAFKTFNYVCFNEPCAEFQRSFSIVIEICSGVCKASAKGKKIKKGDVAILI